MMRAIVLMACLAGAAGIAGYTHLSGEREQHGTVFVAPPRTALPARPPPASPPPAVEIPMSKAALARALQRELQRVGCYSGDINGIWTTSSRMAMKAFTDRVNASLPIDAPDPVLLSLVRNHDKKACGLDCPPGHTASGGGPCLPDAIAAKTAPTVTAAPAAKTEAAAEKTGSALLPAAAAAVAVGRTAAPKAQPDLPDDRARPTATVAAPPADKTEPSGREQPERSARKSGPVPHVGVRERRTRRSAERAPRPPRFVRDFLRTVERTFGLR
jgi:hypothetical protein